MNELEYKMKNFLACDRVFQALELIVEKINSEAPEKPFKRDIKELDLLENAYNSLIKLYEFYKKPFLSDKEVSAELSALWFNEREINNVQTYLSQDQGTQKQEKRND